MGLGGSKVSESLDRSAATYGRRFVDNRTVVMILSDGYDTASPDAMSAALIRLKKRGCKIIWLNPLKGWDDYAPTAHAMAHALPHMTCFAQPTHWKNWLHLNQNWPGYDPKTNHETRFAKRRRLICHCHHCPEAVWKLC